MHLFLSPCWYLLMRCTPAARQFFTDGPELLDGFAKASTDLRQLASAKH
jgi:hypothetical protein